MAITVSEDIVTARLNVKSFMATFSIPILKVGKHFILKVPKLVSLILPGP